MRLYGVFIGINHYEDRQIHNLRFARADAEKFDHLVQDSIVEDERYTFLLTDGDATRSEILHLIGVEVATIVTPEDILIIHFSCHGSPELNNSIDAASRYLIPYDACYDNIFGTAIDMERDLKRLLERIHANLVVVFIDACFSGIAGGRTFEGPNLQQVRSEFRTLISLQNIELGEGRIIMTAADDSQVALEKGKLGHGVFSYALFEALTDSQVPDNTISVAALYDRVSARVYELSDGSQTPVLNGRSRLGKIPRFP